MHLNERGTLVVDLELQPCKSHDRSSPQCTAVRHGTAAAYRRGCRCDTARRAIAHYEQERLLDALHGRSRTLPNIGAIRRLHALRALGYTSRDLAARIGVDERNIARWPHRTWISRTHHDAVCRVYNQLADTPGPDVRARRHAARQGWLPPLWWDDDTIDDATFTPNVRDTPQQAVDSVAISRRALDGDLTVTLNRAEKAAALELLIRKGHALSAAGARLGINATYARRYLANAGQPDHLEETG